MASSEGGVLTIASKLSIALTHKKLIDELSLCLDRDTRSISNWKDLAWEMKVDKKVIKKLEQYSDFSPTIRLFAHLEVTQPDLDIERLRNALLEIGRNDLLSLLTTEADCADSEKVKEVITSPNIEASSLHAGLLDEIALALDSTSQLWANWYHLAMTLGVPRKTCLELKRRSTQNPTNRVFQYFAASRPQMTVKVLKEALRSTERKDLLKTLQNLSDESLIKDIITPGSDLLQMMAVELNREEVPGVKNWTHLACKLEVPSDVLQEISGESTAKRSPTREVIQWLGSRFPDTTLSDLVQALEKIQRNDAIQIITKQFPDTFVAEKEGQPGHCVSLPDRTDLVGREETFELIMNTLTSNKSVEIVAPPGYGKTSVVAELAHKITEKGKRVAYVNPRGVTCVEDLGGKIMEALGAVPVEYTIKETLGCIRGLGSKSVMLIIENIDNLLHLQDKVSKEKYVQEFGDDCAKMRGKYKKDEFLRFLTDLRQCPTIHLVLTSRETVAFSVRFPSVLIELQPLSEKDSATLFTKRDKSLDNELVRELVRVCCGIPLVICTVLAILQRENPENLARRLSESSPRVLIEELCPDFITYDDRIDKCLEVCFNRLSQENQDVLAKISTFPHRFTENQFLAVFKSQPGLDLRTCMHGMKHSSLVRFDRRSCHYSVDSFIRNFISLMPQHKDAKSVFVRHYSDLATTLCEQFLSKDSKSAIDRYGREKENIREAMTWCGDDHPELEQTTREYCICCFNKSAVFLAKVMRKQEFESLFCKLSYRCRYDMHLYSACLTNMGMKIVLSCTCTPRICRIALYRAKCFLSHANEIQSSLTAVDDAIRAHCLSKLGFCLVCEGDVNSGYDHLKQALTLRKERTKHSEKDKDKVMLAACHNDLAASQMTEGKHLAAIETSRLSVLPDYESILGDHPFVATTLSWIANSYHALGDYDNAIDATRRALEIRERFLGEHQETARSLYDLGVALSEKKEYESALESLQKAVALQEEVLDTHEELILTRQAMSTVLKALGREEEAERQMQLVRDSEKKLDSLEVRLETLEIREEQGWLVYVSDPVPISKRQ